MAIRYGKALPAAQRRFKDRYTALVTAALEQIAGIVAVAATGEGGTVPINRADEIAGRAGEIIQGVFVVDGRRSITSEGVPLSPYARALMTEIAQVMRDVVTPHATYMDQQLDPQTKQLLMVGEYRTWLAEQWAWGNLTKEEVERLRIFSPNPLATYEPAHTWVDPNGYTLSQRIWNNGVRTRQKLDGLLTDLISSGASSLEISRTLEQFLLPDRAGLRTRRPYGTDASYDAMRLARTEIARAHNQAAYLAALANPYVDRIRIQRSSRGDPKCPICREHAGQVGGNGKIYELGGALIPTYHPNCMCRVEPLVTPTPAQLTAQLQQGLQQARQDLLDPLLTPLMIDTFIQMLLGEQGAQILPQLLPMQPPLPGI